MAAAALAGYQVRRTNVLWAHVKNHISHLLRDCNLEILKLERLKKSNLFYIPGLKTQ
jgi:hypothetical protein